MKGILGLAVFCLLAVFTDAQVTGWTVSDFDVSFGTGTKTVSMKLKTKVVETSTASAAIVTVTAAGTGPFTYALPAASNPNTVGSIGTASSGAITLISGKSIDYETTKTLVFVVTATHADATVGTATVTVEIKNKVEFSNTHYVVCVPDGATAGTTVGTYTVADKASDDTIAYTRAPNTHFDYGATTGVVSVLTAVTLDMKTLGGQAVTLTATPSGGSSDTTAATATLWIAIGTCSSSALQITAMLGMLILSFVTALFV